MNILIDLFCKSLIFTIKLKLLEVEEFVYLLLNYELSIMSQSIDFENYFKENNHNNFQEFSNELKYNHEHLYDTNFMPNNSTIRIYIKMKKMTEKNDSNVKIDKSSYKYDPRRRLRATLDQYDEHLAESKLESKDKKLNRISLKKKKKNVANKSKNEKPKVPRRAKIIIIVLSNHF